jgi:transposase|tara:strand:+ start:62 stop:358 length:297 start_codon:yes stop_codon:yes gene_type:complete
MSTRRVTNYTKEFKQSSAELAVSSAQSISQTAKELGVCAQTLHGWVEKYVPTVKPTKSARAQEDAQTELSRLRKELSIVTQERDILKKAVACFAKPVR